MNSDDVTSFANLILSDWEDAMQRFFEAVDRRREEHGLTPAEVAFALDIGYGDEVGDAWREWDEA